ncbi:homoserine dehydrogenase [Olsenella sp. HMSC062G07]|uniref:homoserine dehydrogenase n=1 Tax=Olsenella sp. HMSC062G07 TaxID=1739330 RepID=UPI0008A55176|nr:homoserine dehydrogenase [Olsenella sp. HMSC062G07]OFK23995.1 homoserine dehydrogenase [Olsenella sp. HMSC062G07]
MKIALLGHGTVGQGVDRIIAERVEGVKVARILELPGRLTDPRMTASFDDIVNDDEIELVVECMGGIEPAHAFIVRALSAGKAVVTSNKAVVAAHFAEFAQVAATSGSALLIEATCAGGIPWISGIERVRRVDDVTSFSGIMNGTTNYVIDAMVRQGADFADVLAEAQRLGYAERDPSADIDGVDVRNKTLIAACVAFGVACTGQFPVTGLRTVTKADIDLLASLGRTVKLLGRGVRAGGSYAVCVEPVALPQETLEAHVPSNFNLVTLVGSTVGELKFYGQGAGMLPTGNAIVQDVIDYQEGRRPRYDLGGDLAYDPTLLGGDYLFRTADRPAGGEACAPGAYLVRDVTAQKARELFERALETDATSFMAALPREA